MFDKKFIVAAVVAVCVLSGLYFGNASASKNLKEGKVSITSADGVVHEFKVELALTPEQQEMGLMHRESMPEDSGMLFVFGDEKERAFYMKNTLIPLDMIFIKKNGVIGYIHENAIPHDLTSILSNGKAYAVLEINGGVSSKRGIKAGDVVKGSYFED